MTGWLKTADQSAGNAIATWNYSQRRRTLILTEVKRLNKRATGIFNKLIEGLTKVGDHKKIDNSDSAFMPVCVEVVDETKIGLIVSVAHYYEQNGDLMRDPECTFLVCGNEVFPLTFRQDNLGIDRVSAAVQEDGHVVLYPRPQRDITRFCNQWMCNINEQQQLGVK
jgi:hypothetical protein